jgi:phosphatidylserine/phosphatidylglycerophosphate/cardiolipin synthase-like enzyme
MTKRDSKQKRNVTGPAGILGAVLVIIAAIVFAVTGVDLTGGTLNNQVDVTRVGGTVTVPATTATPLPAPATSGVATALPPTSAGGIQSLPVTNALGFQKDFWRVYFTVPQSTTNRSLWTGGIEDELVAAIKSATRTLDIAAFEWESEKMTAAVLEAFENNVTVRMVVDDEHALNNPDTTLGELEAAGIPIVDDSRTALMHNKFIVIDGLTVWTGSMNYQPNDLFRNNNNVIMLRSKPAADVFTAEFNEMFVDKRFGKTSPQGNTGNFNQSGTNIQVYFGAENTVLASVIAEVNAATTSIRFAAFSFTDFDLAKAMMDRSAAGVGVQGVFETTGSMTEAAELRTLYCAGIPVFQDGNAGVLHNKVIIIDGTTVVSGSFNFSSNAANNNDENLMIIKNAEIAQLYLQEWDRIRAIARAPRNVTCE